MDAIRKLEQENVRVFKNARETGRKLGVGSFGCVVELTIKATGKFAGKKFHEALIIDRDSSILVKECKLMSELIHPNITKFCGVCKLPSCSLPVLVMELMDYSLENIIENDKEHFPYLIAISVFIDIANGLAYLHGRTPRVLHRDLTARNVLLNKTTMTAKITDFGNSRMVDETKVFKSMTQAPGTQVYMPPEAVNPHSKYGDRLDIFSFGHLALYALIREFPKDLLPPTYMTPEGKLAAHTEVERRSEYMEKLNEALPESDHHLQKLTVQCLHNSPAHRPSATELLHWLQVIQKLEQEDFEELYLEATDVRATQKERITGSLMQMQVDLNRRQAETTEHEDHADGRKTGLIEKKSGRIRREWKAYSFTLDYTRGIFQYTRPGPFGKTPQIQLDEITQVKPLKSASIRFPFEVHFFGKNSPWELSVYSEADRRDWVDALQVGSKKNLPQTSTQLLPKVTKEDSSLGGRMQKNLAYNVLPLVDENLYDEVRTNNEDGAYVNWVLPRRRRQDVAPPLPPRDTTGEEEEGDVCGKIDALKALNRTQVDAFAQKLAESKGALPQNTSMAAPEDHMPNLTFQPLVEPTKPQDTADNPPPPAASFQAQVFQQQTEEGIYEDLDQQYQYSLAEDLPTERRDSCASLELLQKRALSIRLSSLSHMEKIGEGQYGEVYRAEIDNTTVAVKVIKRFSSKRVMDKFENEMIIMSQVSHNNIVRLHGILREGPFSPALVMEYLPYGNLKNFLSMERQPVEFLMKCMTDVAMGMHYLSEKGLIHRDLAARNVLVDESMMCKVSDFGLLREVPKDKNVYVSQNEGQSPLRWMAPESINDNIFSSASDVWSYGILQWEMFFPDRNPYHNMQTTQMVAKVSRGYRMPIPRGCPSLAAKIMRACWAHNPKERPTFLLISNLLAQRHKLAV